MKLKRFFWNTAPLAIIYVLWVCVFYLALGGRDDLPGWISSWAKWDSVWYEKIWNNGYQADLKALVFPPGYSVLVGSTSGWLKLNFGTAAVLVNLICFFCGTVLAANLLAAKFQINRSLLFLLILVSPASYFVFASYSDSVFFLLFWTALNLFDVNSSNRYIETIEWVILLIGPWFRIAGYALCTVLLAGRKSGLAVFVSLLGWLGMNYVLTGNAFYFLEGQTKFLMRTGHFLDGLRYSLMGLLPLSLDHLGEVVSYLQYNLLPIFYLAFLLCTAIWLMLRKCWMESLILLAVLFVSHNQAFWRSVVRYDWLLMPFLMTMLLSWAKHAGVRGVIARIFVFGVGAAQFALAIWFGRLFREGYWAF